MRYLMMSLILLSWMSCQAAVYQQVDKNGQIVYSDFPLKQNATIINLNPEAESGSAPATTNVSLPMPADNQQHSYNVFSMMEPIDKQTFQNQRFIPFKIKTDPELQEGDKIQIMIDGKPAGVPVQGTQLEVEMIRGEHQVSAVIVDKNDQVLKVTPTITIYVHLASVNKP